MTGISLPSIFSQSAERPHEQRRMASKKEQLTFRLVFRCLNHTFFSWKVFHGFQKGQVHSRKHKLSKNIFEDDQVPGHHPRALIKAPNCPTLYAPTLRVFVKKKRKKKCDK